MWCLPFASSFSRLLWIFRIVCDFIHILELFVLFLWEKKLEVFKECSAFVDCLHSMAILTIGILLILEQYNCWCFKLKSQKIHKLNESIMFFCTCMFLMDNLKWLVFEFTDFSARSYLLLKLSTECFRSVIVFFSSRISVCFYLCFLYLSW